MSAKSSSFSTGDVDPIAEQAAFWLARRDRGLSAAEQDEYFAWLQADPAHAEAVARHAAAFERMMQLYEWQPGQSSEVNPDLFAPSRRWRWSVVTGSLAAAAAIVLGVALWWTTPHPHAPALAQGSHLRVIERHALPDGSIVELKDGSRFTIDFTPERRLVRLAGEAHFKVAKNPARPFVVEADGVLVRAVGTAFNVRIGTDGVEVLVTEGTVRLAHEPAGGSPSRQDDALAAAPAELTAGQRAFVSVSRSAPPLITGVSATEIAAALDWQAPRLQFYETPLDTAVAEFNQHNRTQLVLAERALGTVPIGGTFRVDNLDGFVRLLELTLDVRAERRGDDQIVLTRVH